MAPPRWSPRRGSAAAGVVEPLPRLPAPVVPGPGEVGAAPAPRPAPGTSAVETVRLFYARRERAQGGAGYAELLRIVMGDRRGAERLIAMEAARAPGAGRPAWVESAVERARRDR
jgi:hypothetical protein